MIVAHHPLIYQPLKSVAETDPVAVRVAALIRGKVSLFVLHTNYDTVPGGINDVLAATLGVESVSPLTCRHTDSFFKVAVYVPEDAVDAVRSAMADAGAGRIGPYTHCSFRTNGIGSFVPLPAASPYIGDIGKLEEVEEYRLEMVVAGSWLDLVLEAMIEKHPYDEVAYDVYPLENPPVSYGYGRIGTLNEDVTLAEFGDRVKERLALVHIKVCGDPRKTVKKVAVCGGAGSSLFRDAIRSGADVYVTGDTKHHDILDAAEMGLAIIDAGHFPTEKPGMVALTERLKQTFSGMEIEYVE
jgi:dinuclear metal center YbgI/SA1388 family protein